ncbi:hypothetical protein X979_3839 [Burkholderia pseudomallei MSHR7527]|nr:hypothetical protein X979_3839 [Burkholderia pseudomallei MSHR7527]
MKMFVRLAIAAVLTPFIFGSSQKTVEPWRTIA